MYTSSFFIDAAVSSLRFLLYCCYDVRSHRYNLSDGIAFTICPIQRAYNCYLRTYVLRAHVRLCVRLQLKWRSIKCVMNERRTIYVTHLFISIRSCVYRFRDDAKDFIWRFEIVKWVFASSSNTHFDTNARDDNVLTFYRVKAIFYLLQLIEDNLQFELCADVLLCCMRMC